MLKDLKLLFSKTILLFTIIVSSILTSSSKAQDYAVILIYHKFDEPKTPSTSIPLEDFKAQMKYLKDNNYNVVSIDRLLQYYKDGYFPPKTVAITIDDGYKSTMKAFYILKKYNFPFTLFLYAEAINRYPDFLTKKQIDELLKYPYITFGNHSYSHKHFGKFKDVKLFKEDLEKSEKRLKTLLGYVPKYYAYPYGDYNEKIASLLKSKYKAAFAQDPSAFSIYSRLFIIPRQPVVGHWGNLKHFKKILNTSALPVEKFNPPFGTLKINPPKEISAKLNNINDFKSCEIYVSELGWRWAKYKKDTIYIRDIPKLKRWKNRIGFKCYNKKTKQFSTFFYLIVNNNKY